MLATVFALPDSTCPVIRSFLEATIQIMPEDAPNWFFADLAGELGHTDTENPVVEVRRAIVLADAICRKVAPMALRAVGQWQTAVEFEETEPVRDASHLLPLSARVAEVDYRYAKPGLILSAHGARPSAHAAAEAIELAAQAAGQGVFDLAVEIIRSMLGVSREVAVAQLPLHKQSWTLLEQEEVHAAELCTSDEKSCIASIHWQTLGGEDVRENLFDDPRALELARALVVVPQMKAFILNFVAWSKQAETTFVAPHRDGGLNLRRDAQTLLHSMEQGVTQSDEAPF